MKTLFLFLLNAWPILLLGQWTDDFSLGNLNSWRGDTSSFIVNSKNQLNLNANNAGEKFIYRNFANQRNIEWNFYNELQFSPSASNKLRVYINIDVTDLSNFQGYYIEIGENGNFDNWKMYVRHQTKISLLGQGELSKLSSDPSKSYFNFSKKNDSIWLVKVDYDSGINFSEQIEIRDSLNLQFAENYFGIHCFFTATRSNKFIFDDISIKVPIKDTLSPNIIDANTLDANRIKITFDEKIDTNSVKNNLNFGEPKLQNPNKIQIVSQEEIILLFDKEMTSDSVYVLDYILIKDLFGNVVNFQKSFSFKAVFFNLPIKNDIIITEFMPDPDPKINLPNAEFIEIYNRSNGIIKLSDMKISDGNSISGVIKDYNLRPAEFLILCAHKDTSQFKLFGNVLGVSSMPSLNNESDQIILYDQNSIIIDQLEYQLDWHSDNTKREGGYSLELQFLNQSCIGKRAWGTSLHQDGGTPGKINSKWNEDFDKKLPELVSVIALSQWEVQLNFDSKVDELVMKDFINYKITPLITIASVDFIQPQSSEIILLLNEPLTKGVTYTLLISITKDCSGNIATDLNYNFEIPTEVQVGQIQFNEVLFNPKTNGVDYIELNNNSTYLFSTENLYLNNSLKDNNWIKVNQNFLFPKSSYLVLTTDPTKIIEEYPIHDSSKIIDVVIPAIDDDEGFLKLASYQNGRYVIIDSVNFQENWHNPLVTIKEGVALEKISPSLKSNFKTYWTSASKQSYYGTPGLRNSQFIDSTSAINEDLPFSIESLIISPNQDGVNDQLIIHLKLNKPGYKANIKIFDLSGNSISILSQNLLSANEILVWNAVNEKNEVVSTGNYIMSLNFIHPEGDVYKYKQRIVIDGKN